MLMGLRVPVWGPSYSPSIMWAADLADEPNKDYILLVFP